MLMVFGTKVLGCVFVLRLECRSLGLFFFEGWNSHRMDSMIPEAFMGIPFLRSLMKGKVNNDGSQLCTHS